MANSLKSKDYLKLSCRGGGRENPNFRSAFLQVVPSMLELHFLAELKNMNLADL